MAAGYDSIMQPFGQSPGGQERGRIRPGDRLPDGTVYQAPDNAAWYQQEIAKLDAEIASLQAQRDKYQEQLDAAAPPKKTSSRKKSSKKEEESEE